MAKATLIKGNKGGGYEAHTPVESPDSIQSIARAKILVALGEGEFAWGIDGRSIFLDGTPVIGPDGSANFSGVQFDYRTGTQAQPYIPGFPSVENETTVNTELRSDSPWIRSVSNTQLSAVRIRLGWPSLQEAKDNGDVGGYRIQYAIDLQTDGGAYQTVVDGVLDDKTTSLYERTYRIDLPRATTGWTVRVRRLTPNANSGRIADTMNVEAISEVIDAKLRYPNTALLSVQFDAKQFPNRIPQISCKPQGRIIRVPDNYDPVSRTYSGTWQGVFKWAWSNNPAWVFYDLVVSDMFGLGDKITIADVDKWELYRIAQYCDQPVPDGRGGTGTEPRFICDVYLQSREDAWTVLSDLASVFRGATYWWQGQLYALADMPRDMGMTFHNGNIIGKFSRQSGSSRDTYTIAMVAWSDPANHYADATEPVFVNDLVRDFGAQVTEITAIGCTRQSEAHRRGLWALYTNKDDNVHSFKVGLDGQIPVPGNIIGIANNFFAGRVIGGRISAVSSRNITLDRVPDAKPGDRLILNLPSGASQARTIQSLNGKIVTVTASYSEIPEPECGWAIDADDLFIQQCRVISVSDNDDNTYTISAVVHDPDKYARIDTGARIDDRPTTVIPSGVQPSPKNLEISSYSAISQGIAVTTMHASWDRVDTAIAYEAEWRRNSGNWVSVMRTSALGFEVPGIYAGRYVVRVRAINASEISSQWVYSDETTLSGKTSAPPVPVGFSTIPINWGIVLNWGFPPGSEDTLKTVIEYSLTPDGSNPMLLSDVAYPGHQYTQLGLKAGQEFWYHARLVDKTGNQGSWTDWLHGAANANADDYLGDITGDFLDTDAGDRLSDRIDSNLNAAWQAALDNDADAVRRRAVQGEQRAQIIETRQVQADDRHAFAEFKQTISAQVGENTAAIETKATTQFLADGTGSATWGVNAGVTYKGVYYSAGMVVGVQVSDGNVKSQIGFLADRFVVMASANGQMYSPFAITGGQVFLSEAIIQNASITSAKIADAAITNAKISGSIHSDNWNGLNGWNLDKSGGFQYAGSDAGGRILLNAEGLSVFDGSGLLRVKVGKLS